MSKIKAIISDADGTLVNTAYLIRHGQYEAAVLYLVKQGMGRHDIPEFEIYEGFINKSVGGSTRSTFEKTLKLIFGKTHEKFISELDFDELDETLAPVQDHIALLYVHPFHGLTELFTWLGKNQTMMGISTSGNRRMVVRNFGVSLPVLGYTDLFRYDDIDVGERLDSFIDRAKAVYGMPEFAVVTCDDVASTKPDPESILLLLDRFGIGVAEAVVLGDHRSDMEAAKAAGVHSIGISHGFDDPTELTEAGAIRIVDDLITLPGIIEAHNEGTKRLY